MVLALAACMQSSFLLENPASSVILLHPRLVYVLEQLKKFGCPAPCFDFQLQGLPTRK